MKWVTWEHVGVDRIGCAWLIRHWVDPQAEFSFVPRGGALPKDAEPFDIPGVRYSHHRGHCSFRAILEQHQLDDPVLDRIARMIDEADTVQEVSVEPARHRHARTRGSRPRRQAEIHRQSPGRLCTQAGGVHPVIDYGMPLTIFPRIVGKSTSF